MKCFSCFAVVIIQDRHCTDAVVLVHGCTVLVQIALVPNPEPCQHKHVCTVRLNIHHRGRCAAGGWFWWSCRSFDQGGGLDVSLHLHVNARH